MSKFKIYLAGQMTGLTFAEMNGWREEATKLLTSASDKIHIANPCLYYNFEIDPTSFTDYECKVFDLWLVENCDLVLVNLNYPKSIGTAIEMELASRWNKPVIAFGTREDVHPWMKLCVTKWCKTMEEAVEHILIFYVPNK